MPDIVSDFWIRTTPDRVYQAISTPEGLDSWWTKKSTGRPVKGEEFQLFFGPEYDWRAKVTTCAPSSEFELEIMQADPDWRGTRVGFQLAGGMDRTSVRFCHAGWQIANEHWRVSCYCWPMYLRLLRRHLEYGEFVPYEQRLDV